MQPVDKALRSALWAIGCFAFMASCAWNDVSVQRRGSTTALAGGAGGSGGSTSQGATGGEWFAGGTAGLGGAAGGAPELDAGTFTRRALLQAFGECAVDTYREAHVRVQELERVLNLPDADVHGTSERNAWLSVMRTWQEAEVMQFGPAAMSSVPGGKELRDNIYAWPLVNRCMIDTQLVNRGYEGPDFASMLVNVRGLAALEYLLFQDGTDNGCASTASINTSGSWAALSETELSSRKLTYARVIAADVRARTALLVSAWEPSGENFLAQFQTAGSGSNVYARDQAAFNAVSDAIFYVEKEVKDIKLARALGVDDTCAAAICPELLESRFARRAKQHIQANLVGFQKLFLGCGPRFSGLGFDDLLIAAGQEPLARQMRSELERAVAAGAAIEENDLSLALVQDVDSVLAWHAALRELSLSLKNEFVSRLDLNLPFRVETDND